MGRRNRREAGARESLDTDAIKAATNADAKQVRRRLETWGERDARLDEELGRRRERKMRRTDERVDKAITDWKHCCIPGCGDTLPLASRRVPNVRDLPICEYHLTSIGYQWDRGTFLHDAHEMRQRFMRRHILEEERREARYQLDIENDGATEGQIYFLRLNGLIKVGWSGRLRSRLKSYGASAEVLCHYPARREDEKHLHRQLRDNLAKGREWYHDCAAVQLFVTDALKRHGEPTILPFWTEPKAEVVKPRRWAG